MASISAIDIYNEPEKCPDCKSDEHIIEDYRNGEYVCGKCGVVVGDRIIADEAEWRSFDSEPGKKNVDMNRVGGADDHLLGDSQLHTVTGPGSHLSKFNKAAHTNTERALISTFKLINEYSSRLGLSRLVCDRSKELFKRVDDSGELKGRKVEAIVVACIFIACRQNELDRTFKELCAVAEVRKKDVSRCFTKIKQLKAYKKHKKQGRTAAKLMARFCALLKLPHDVQSACEYAAEIASKIALTTGKNPATVCGGLIWLVTQLHPKEKRDIEYIARVVGMADATLRQFYRTIHEARHKLIQPGYASKDDVNDLKKM